MELSTSMRSGYQRLAQAGLVSKGIVYCLIGLMAFMAAFEIGGQSSSGADKEGVFQFVENTGGKFLLGLIVLGLLCYCIWRFAEAFRVKKKNEGELKRTGKRVRYIFSGLVYLTVCYAALRLLLHNDSGSGGNSFQTVIGELLNKPFGQVLAGLFAAFVAGTGIYQIWYGLSEKYKKHTGGFGRGEASGKLLSAGKIGYVARGIVWLIISYFLFMAAFHANSSEAGDTSKAFQFLENGPFGSILLGAVGAGLICYGLFNFIRARYENFNNM